MSTRTYPEMMRAGGWRLLEQNNFDADAFHEYEEFARALSQAGMKVRGDLSTGFWVKEHDYELLALWYTMHDEVPFGAYVVGPYFEDPGYQHNEAPLNPDGSKMTFDQYVAAFMRTWKPTPGPTQKEGADTE